VTRRALAAVGVAICTFAVAGPYAAEASATSEQPAAEQPSGIEVAPNASAASYCLLNGLICLF